MTSASPGFEVRHNTAASRFEVELDGHLSVCDYRLAGGGAQMVMNHTEVPPELGGRGIAAALVQAALDWARAQKLLVVPQCSYVATYMKRHPQTLDLMAP
jgi:uncharacterized protein